MPFIEVCAVPIADAATLLEESEVAGTQVEGAMLITTLIVSDGKKVVLIQDGSGGIIKVS